jgi:hypothetical protein
MHFDFPYDQLDQILILDSSNLAESLDLQTTRQSLHDIGVEIVTPWTHVDSAAAIRLLFKDGGEPYDCQFSLLPVKTPEVYFAISRILRRGTYPYLCICRACPDCIFQSKEFQRCVLGARRWPSLRTRRGTMEAARLLKLFTLFPLESPTPWEFTFKLPTR